MEDFMPRTIKWSESPRDRDVFLDIFEEFYGPLPDVHLEAISSIHQDDRGRVNQWCSRVVPMKTMDMLDFPYVEQLWIRSDVPDEQIAEWLHHRGVPYQTQVYVFLNDEYDRILVMPWKLVVKYWEALERHSSYALIVMDKTAQWACLIHHEEYIQFGSYADVSTEHDA